MGFIDIIRNILRTKRTEIAQGEVEEPILKTVFPNDPPEWIGEAYREIESLKPYEPTHSKDSSVRYSLKDPAEKKPDIKYSRKITPVEDIKIKYSLSFDDEDDEDTLKDFKSWQKVSSKRTFQEQLLTYIRERNMSNPDFYKAAYIDRKLFSAMISNKDYKPSKDTAISSCFGLRLNVDKAKDLLESAGYSLSLAIPRDRIFYYCLDHRIYDLNKVNELLYYLEEKCIGV